MKKSKLILLTILMILVLYCGAVIFVTKPDSFAYSAIFGDTNPRSTASSTQSASAANIDTSAIVAEAKEAAVKAAESTIDDMTSKMEAGIRRAIEQSLPAMIDNAVRKAVAEQNLSDQIAKKVSEEIEGRQAEIASSLYRTYKDSLVDELSTELAKDVEQGEAQSVTDYDAQRTAIRNAMISSLLSKLED